MYAKWLTRSSYCFLRNYAHLREGQTDLHLCFLEFELLRKGVHFFLLSLMRIYSYRILRGETSYSFVNYLDSLPLNVRFFLKRINPEMNSTPTAMSRNSSQK